MGAVFVKILNMSLTAGWIVLAVLLVRLLFKKKAPKALFPILWAMVAVRLVCPITFESNFSLIRNAEPMEHAEEFLQKETVHTSSEKETLPEGVEPVELPEELPPGGEFVEIDTPELGEGVTDIFEGLDESGNKGTENTGDNHEFENQGFSDDFNVTKKETPFSVTYTEIMEDGTEVTVKRTDYSAIIAVLWLGGMVGMFLYTAISYFLIYRRVRESAPLSKNVRVCDNIDSPFILGIVRPKIYLPSDINAADRVFVLAHERAHLKRFDHIWKPLGFLLLSIYWFHPLLWVAYVLLCKDIEYACDEKVIKELGAEQKKTYSTALINCSVSRKMLSACPLAFGETGVKGRVKSVLHYKKPAFWIIIASVVVSAVLAICFLTNPLRKAELPKAGDIITFGTYEQDNVTENGAEPIEWIVVDVFDGKATLLSKYGLDAKPYHEEGSKGIYWEDCSLRSWLNTDFFMTAFSEDERKRIITTRLDNHGNASYNVKDGAVTEDKVYLLSIDELYQIFKTEAGLNESQYRNKASITSSTAYAKAQGVWEGTTEEGNPASPWLLRTLGVNYTSVCRVNTYGELSHEVSNDYGGCAIRPAMRIDLEKAEYELLSASVSEEEAEKVNDTLYTGSGRFKDMVSLEDAKPGYLVEFGTYEQNQDTGDGAEPIEWYVLDVKDGRALLLSKYILENMPYHKYEEEISWKNCTLREWLNGTFYEAAFNDEEKKRIATTLLENVWNPWNTFANYEYTEDKVFLPSMEDMLSGDYFYTEKAPESAAYTFDGYLTSDTERMARGVYEEDQWLDYGGYYLYNFDGMPYGAYWLRASSRTEYRPSDEKKEDPYLVVAGISIDGSLDTTVNNTIGNTRYDENGVRPAIWVELGDLDEIAKKNEKKNKESNKKSSLFLSSKLPERYAYKEVKESFLEYLNHQAYLYPAEYSQEKWECAFEVYSTADSKMKRVYLKAEVNGEERWYLCTPTVYLEDEAPLTILPMDAESVESLRSTGAIKHLGTDTVKVAAAKAPEYHKNIELDATGYKESIALISDELCKNGYLLKNETYTDVIKLDAWISEFDMEKMLYPHAYIIINDSYVYETSFTKYKGLYANFYNDNYAKDHSLENHFGEQVYMPDEFDGRSIKPLASVDQAQLEHVKNCAALHYVHEPDFSVTITVDGKEITLPKQNVCLRTEDYTSIAFVPQETTGDITRYHIYRSTDGGERWSLVSKNFKTNAEEIAAIEVPEDDYVVCYFNRVGSTYHSSCYFSEDGGVTWSMPEHANKPKVDLADAAVGTSVVFGSYEQDFDLSNGKEPVEWIVLDRVGDKVLLLSRYGVETDQYYHYDTWEESEVRRELNEYFYVDAFSPSERERIVKTEIKTPNDTGIDIVTEDYVFLLSESEVLEGKAQDGTPYFKDTKERLTIPSPMEGIGAWVYSDCESNEWDGIQTKWLLRAKGSNMNRVWVAKDGTIRTDGRDYELDTVTVLYRPAIWVDLSGLEGDPNQVPKDTTSVLQPSDFLREQIESTNISIAIGDKYAAYLDEKGKLHVLYDTSLIWEWDPVGATRGIDLTKTYKTLGTDPLHLVAIDEEGKLSVSYFMTAEEVSEYCNQAAKDAADNGGTYGIGGVQSWIANDFEEMSEVKHIFSTYPYSTYTALFEDGTVYHYGEQEALEGAVQITKDGNGILAGIKADGTVVMTEIGDVLRKKKLDTWPEKLKQIVAGYNFFVGLCEDGTVISEGVEQDYMINTVEQWCDIVKIAAENETVVGLKGDGTVVAVCPGRSNVGQCDVDDWTDVIAVNTNGKVTIGITKDGKVLMAGAVPELVKALPERYNYEEIKSLLLEYLNHQAWLYPSKYPQESYTCSYELYCNTNDTKTKYVYLKTVIKETEYWYQFKPEEYYDPASPNRIVLQRTDIKQESLENGNIASIGSDEIYVPAVTKPSYGKPVDDFTEQNIANIFSDLKRNGYRNDLKLEVIISEYDMEKGLFPYAYLIINDSKVFETTFGKMQGNNIDLYPLYQMYYYGNYARDYTIEYGDGWPEVYDGHGFKPLDTMDTEQLNRIKACAVYHKILIDDGTESILVNEQPVQSPKSNVAINEELGVGIIFLPQWTLANTVHYNIYRTEDSGISWRLIAENYTATEGGIARILIPEKDTIVCYFNKSGTTSQSSCIVSEDGGITWKEVSHHSSKPNAFTYDPQKGSSVIFGAYEQDGDESNGKEPLEWLVLDRDGDRALLLSRYGIETMQWDKNEELEIWEEDALYWMMNRTIYEYAFSAKERAALIQANPIENESIHFTNEMLLYKGYTFLLTTDDVLSGQGQDETKYFRTEESRITIPTASAAQKGAWIDKNGEFAGVEAPWLVAVTGTTEGDFSEVQFARVMPDGSISYEEEAIKEQHVLIRPAIWVDVTKIPQ